MEHPVSEFDLGSAEPLDVANAFHADGYVVLRNVLSKDLVQELHQAAMANFRECLATIESKGLEFGMHAKKGFKEIVQRNRGRYEMPYGMDDTEVFQSPELVENEKLIAVLDAILGDNVPPTESSRSRNSPDAVDSVTSGPHSSPPSQAEETPRAAALPGDEDDVNAGSEAKTTKKKRAETEIETATTSSIRSWHRLGWSIVNSTPGALEQQWHVDGAHVDIATHRKAHVLNVSS